MSKKTTNTSSTPNIPNTCSGCPKTINSGNETSTPQIDNNGLATIVTQNVIQIEALKTNVEQIKNDQDKQADFYRFGAKLSNVARIAIIVLLIVPLLQLIACTAVVYYLGIQEQLNGLLSWVLGGVSLFSIIDIVFVIIKFTGIEKRVEELEKRLDKPSQQ